MASRGESGSSGSDKIEEGCFALANELIRMCGLPLPHIIYLKDVNCYFFIRLFEKVCGIPVPDLILDPPSVENEEHNAQSVIDALSLDILNISLSHITGEDIIAGNAVAIYNLLEVFHGYIAYVIGPERAASTEFPMHGSTTIPTVTPVAHAEVCYLCGKQKGKELAAHGGTHANSCPACSSPPLEASHHVTVASKSVNEDHISPEASSSVPIEEFSPDPGVIEGTLQNISDKVTKSSSGSSRVSVPHPTLVDSEKLRPEFASVGKRPHTTDQQDITYPKLFGSKSSARSNETVDLISDRSSTLTPHQSDSKSSLDRCTMLFKSDPKQKPYPHAKDGTGPPLAEPKMKSDARAYHRQQKSKSLNNLDSVRKVDTVTQTPTHIPRDVKTDSITKSYVPVGESSENVHQRRQVTESDIEELYRKNLLNKVQNYLEEKTHHKRHVSQIRRTYERALRTPKRRPLTPCKKSFLLPAALRRKPSFHTTPKKLYSPSHSIRQSNKRKATPSENHEEANFIRELREEFPGVHLSPSTIKCMRDKYEKQLFNLCKSGKDTLMKKSQKTVQVEEAAKRQKILGDILRKEIHHNHYMNDFNELKELERQVESTFRDARHESARMKQYYDNFHLQMKRRMMKRNYAEEQLVKDAFEEQLSLQKEQVQQLQKQLKERQMKDGKCNQIYLDALENFYQAQFALLAESLAVEKRDYQERKKAQKRVLRMMKTDYRDKLQDQVRKLQDKIVRNREDIHFRELDAERYKERMRDKFSAHPLHKI